MKIKLFWPQCDFVNKKWVNEGIDSFWVESSYEEAEICIFPYLSNKQIEESKRNCQIKDRESNDIGIDARRLYYLVSKDLKSIESFSWYYPYSGQWNAYCPFQEIKEIEIKELKEIKNIKI